MENATTIIVLSPGPAAKPQYRFRHDTLQLYSDDFHPDALTLIVRPAADSVSMYQLRSNGVLYTLDKNATGKTALKKK